MKKRLVLFITMFCIATNIAMAQTNINYYPDSTGIIVFDGYTYKYRYKYGTTELYNMEDTYIDVEKRMANGDPLPTDLIFGEVPTIIAPRTFKDNVTKIISDQFSTIQKASIRDKAIRICVIVNPLDGSILHVRYYIHRNSPFRHIPTSVYHNIEVKLKGLRRTLVVTPIGKELNYVMYHWFQKIQ